MQGRTAPYLPRCLHVEEKTTWNEMAALSHLTPGPQFVSDEVKLIMADEVKDKAWGFSSSVFIRGR